MSWSFRKRSTLTRHPSALVWSAIGAGIALAAPGFGAEVYVQPIVSVSAEDNTNLDLEQGPNPNIAGYSADAATLIGVATPNSDTAIRPRVDYRYYPTDSFDDRLEAYLDVNSTYNTQRSNASTFMEFERRDQLTAELNSANYNQIGPVSPTSPETGRITVGGTRTSVLLLPDYRYKITPLTAVGVSAIYQQIEYSPENSANAVDFRYYLGRLYMRWTLDQRNQVSLGGYGSKYEALHFDSRSTAGGVSVHLDTDWSPLLSTGATALYQHTTVDSTIPTLFKANANPWGATVNGEYTTQTQQFRLDGGRIITPSGGGGIYVNEQVQFQYDRKFTRRLTFTGAAIWVRNHGLTSNANGNDRTYWRPAVDLKWMMTRTFFLQGGYEYVWQKYQLDTFSAENNRIYIRFGYQGLGRQE